MNRILSQGSGMKAASLSLLLVFTVPLLSACVPVLIGAATVTTISVATDRRTVGRNLDDNTLELALRKDFLLDDKLDGSNVSVTAINGIVLLTGEVATDAQRRHAENIAKSHVQTLSVVNELQLAGSTSITSRTNDTLITSKVKAKLLAADDVQANAVKVVTEGGKVYLLGLVTRSEAEAAVRETREVGGVTHIVKVFEYIKG
jgi:osmotically-inducible protein OsmY